MKHKIASFVRWGYSALRLRRTKSEALAKEGMSCPEIDLHKKVQMEETSKVNSGLKSVIGFSRQTIVLSGIQDTDGSTSPLAPDPILAGLISGQYYFLFPAQEHNLQSENAQGCDMDRFPG